MQKYRDVVIPSNSKNLAKYVAQSLRERSLLFPSASDLKVPPLRSVRMTREVWGSPYIISKKRGLPKGSPLCLFRKEDYFLMYFFLPSMM